MTYCSAWFDFFLDCGEKTFLLLNFYDFGEFLQNVTKTTDLEKECQRGGSLFHFDAYAVCSMRMSIPNYAVDFKDWQLLTNGRFQPYDIEIKSMW